MLLIRVRRRAYGGRSRQALAGDQPEDGQTASIKISGIPARLRRQDHRIGDARLHAVSEWYLAIPPAVNSESLSGIYVR